MTDSEHIVQWWAPKGMKISGVEHDFKVGGKWKFSMLMPDGNAFISEGRYWKLSLIKNCNDQRILKPMTEGVELHVLFEKTVINQFYI